MNTRTLVTAGLLVFVAVAVVAVIIRDRGGSTSEIREALESPNDGPRIVAWYLHGQKRCATCRKIELTTREVVDRDFGDDLAAGRLIWRVTNYDEPGNEHLMDDYEVASPSVVLLRENGGKVEHWENLERVWELIGDTPAYETYVASKVRTHLEEGE